MGGIPIRVAVVDGQLTVLAVQGEIPLRRGDVILEVDGVPAMDVVHERERHVSGSPHLLRFRALNQFGEGALDSVARLAVRREDETLSLEIPRREDRRGFFFNPVSPFEFPDFAEVRPGIFYVNVPSLDKEVFREKLDQLANARGVIFDQRWDGRMPKGGAPVAQSARLQPHADIIPHLIGETVEASPMRVPQVVAPDRAGWSWRESTWPVKPKAPRFAGRVVFINEPSVVSYGETCMAMIADYQLATLVGEPTAGCNGNVNFIPLPGGFRIMWTGMEVLKHDRSPFYTVGFVPDYPVTRTLAAIKEGKDETLERAIAVIEGTAGR
jgi:C-terminal processing protease CtpA/Prc